MDAARALFRAPLWDVLGEHTATASTTSATPRPRECSSRAAGVIAGLRRALGAGPQRRRRVHRGRVHAADPPRLGRRRPAAARSSGSAPSPSRPARRALPRGQRVPRRRRRAPRDAARRHRHEHRDPRRLRPRLEARLGAARLGRSRRCSTPTRRSAGRSPSTTSRARPIRADRTGRSRTSCTPISADRIPHLWVPRRQAASRRSTCSARADPLHRARRADVGGRRRVRARPRAARRAVASMPQRTGARHPCGGALLTRPTVRPPAGGRAAPTRCRRCTPPSGRPAGALRAPPSSPWPDRSSWPAAVAGTTRGLT